MSGTQPNILLIMTDQQSADAMGCTSPRETLHTPAMDRLATVGLRFTRAYCAHPLCGPSRAAMFTGRYPHATGYMTNTDLNRPLTGIAGIATVLRDAGYDTGYVGKWHLPWPTQDAPSHGFAFTANNICNGADAGNLGAARTFLQRPRRGPFLLVASYNNPHNICEWARGARGQLPDGTLDDPPPPNALPPRRANAAPQRGEPDALAAMRRAFHANPMFPVGNFSDQQWREYQWAYHRMIEHVDRKIAQLLAMLDATDVRDNTAIVFLSDHGDAQGAHGWNQKTILEDESSRVPCILSCPGRVYPGTSAALVQTGIDLGPTLCDMAQVNAPSWMTGQSMVDTTAKRRRPFIVAHTRFSQAGLVDGIKPTLEGRMVRSERYKYCLYDQGTCRESLVDMQQDPGEMVNLATDPAHAEVLVSHRRWLADYACQQQDPFARFVIEPEYPGKCGSVD